MYTGVLPETKCQGLFSTPAFHCMKKATVDFSTMAVKLFLFTFDYQNTNAQTEFQRKLHYLFRAQIIALFVFSLIGFPL